MDQCQQVHLVGDKFGTVNQKVTFQIESSVQYIMNVFAVCLDGRVKVREQSVT